MKRYFRPEKMKVKKKVKPAKREKKTECTCWVCFKKIQTKNAVEIGWNRKMCIEHDDAYHLSPLQYIMNLKSMEAG